MASQGLSDALEQNFERIAIGSHAVFALLLVLLIFGFVPWAGSPAWALFGLLGSCWMLYIDVLGIQRMPRGVDIDEEFYAPPLDVTAAGYWARLAALIYLTLHCMGMGIAILTLIFPVLLLPFFGLGGL